MSNHPPCRLMAFPQASSLSLPPPSPSSRDLRSQPERGKWSKLTQRTFTHTVRLRSWLLQFPLSSFSCRAGVRRLLGHRLVRLRYVSPSTRAPLVSNGLTWAIQGRWRRHYCPRSLHAEVRSQKPQRHHQYVEERSRFRSRRLGASGWSVLRCTRECSHLRCVYLNRQHRTSFRTVLM